MKQIHYMLRTVTGKPLRSALALFMAFVLTFTMLDITTMRPAYATNDNPAATDTVEQDNPDPDTGADDSLEGATDSSGVDLENNGIVTEETAESSGDVDEISSARAGPEESVPLDVQSTPEEEISDEVSSNEPADTSTAAIETSATVTFYSAPSDQNPSILARSQVSGNPGTMVSVDVSQISAEPPTSEQIFSGWWYDGVVETKSIEIDPAVGSVDLYPVFDSGHWLRFVAGTADSGAVYVESQFVAADAEALTALPTSTRAGYSFDGWFEGSMSGASIEYGTRITDHTGAILDPAYLRAALAESDIILYASWQGIETTYRVVIWHENADDDQYTFDSSYVYGQNDGERALSGQMTEVADLPEVEGFTIEPIIQQRIAGDGSTIANVYYKRNLYDIVFHKERVANSAIYSDLTIHAKFGEDIHDRWPVPSENETKWGTAWYTLPDTNSNVFVSGISTMPLDGAHFYPKTDTGGNYATVYRTQNVDGSNTFSDYVIQMFSTKNSPSTTADDYNAIKGFMVNAATSEDAVAIIANPVGDPAAVSNSSFDTSAPVGANYDEAPEVTAPDGKLRHTLYFHYLRCQYDIVFIENGGADVADATDIYYEASIADEQPTTYRIGETTFDGSDGVTYTFAGWFDNEALVGEPFDFTKATMPAGNLILYAKWTPAEYLVQIDPAGGEFVNANQSTYFTVLHGQTTGDLPVERHYVSDPDGDFAYTYETSDSDSDGFGRSEYVTPQEGYEGERYSYAENAYSFYGWYRVEADGTLTHFDLNQPITQDTMLVAKWRTAGTYDIAYNPDALVSGVEVNAEIEDGLDSGYSDLSPTFIANTPYGITAATGTYRFLGWQLVSGFDEDAEVLDETLYREGDIFVVDSDYARNNVLHLQALYEEVEEPVTPVDPTDPTSPDTGDSAETTGSATATSATSATSALPQTGDLLKTVPLVITSIALLALAIALVGYGIRSRTKIESSERKRDSVQ